LTTLTILAFCVHQRAAFACSANELWFKQIILELDSAREIFSVPVSIVLQLFYQC